MQSVKQFKSFEKQHAVEESLDERFQRYYEMFEVTDAYCAEAFKCFAEACWTALKTKKSVNKMQFLDTCITLNHRRCEPGLYFSVYLTGSDLQVYCCELKLDGTFCTKSNVVPIDELGRSFGYPKGLKDPRVTATQFFDVISLHVKKFVEAVKVPNTDAPLYCTVSFSFGVEQFDLQSGTLIRLNKSFETGRQTNDKLENSADLCELMSAAFDRHDVPLEVIALCNDASCVLLAGAYITKRRNFSACAMSLINGTGLNICFSNKICKKYGFVGTVINSECGNYAGFKPNIIDLQVDMADASTGMQIAEKMISCSYLGEICRRTLLRIFRNEAPELLWAYNSLTPDACCLVGYEKSETYELARCMAKEMLDWELTDVKQLHRIRTLFRAILRRSARLLGILIAGIAGCTGRLQSALGGLVIAVKKSLYSKYDDYMNDLTEALEFVLGSERARLIRFEYIDSSMGIGGALLAANAIQST